MNTVDKINQILTEITKEDYTCKDADKLLFSEEYKLDPRDIVYLMLFIERDFKVVFLAEQINDLNFYTVNNIAKIIDLKEKTDENCNEKLYS